MRWLNSLSHTFRTNGPLPVLYFLFFAFTFFSCGNSTKHSGASVDDFASTINTTLLEKHLYTLADTSMHGRETASEGEKMAATYIEKEFKLLGLQAAVNGKFIVPFNVYRDSLISVALIVRGTRYTRYKDFDVYMNYGHRHRVEVKDAVYAGHGLETKKVNDYKEINAEGKVVIVEDGEPMLNDSIYAISGTKNKSRLASVREKLKNAMQHKATALFIVKKGKNIIESTDAWGRLYVESEKNEKPIPVFFISEHLKSQVLGWRKVDTRIPFSIHITDSCKTISMQSRNVMAVLPGTDKKDEYVFITGHYDHLGKKGKEIYCGADDNASGTAGVLAIAKAFAEAKKAGKGPRRTIVFMLVSGEEKGLLGSKHYTANPLFPMQKTSVDLNIDMIGRVGEEYVNDKDSLNYVYVIGDDKLSSQLAIITNKCNKKLNMTIDRRYNNLDDPNRFYFRSDHYNFAKNGVPIIFYFNGVHKDYHKPTDTKEKINFAVMSKRARLVFYTAWEIANMPQLLKRDIPLAE